MSRERVRVWDLPTRLFHWAIVLLVPAMWATHELHQMDVHIVLGEIMLGLVLFRLIWGVIGSSTARFAGFVRGPAAIRNYLRGQGGTFGHNPIGALSVVAMLLVLATQVGLGLFASDEDGLETGPLSHNISYDSARTLAERHETVFYILLVLIALHIAAIAYYRFAKGNRLVAPMITGERDAPDSGERMTPAPAWRFWLAAGLATGITVAISRFL